MGDILGLASLYKLFAKVMLIFYAYKERKLDEPKNELADSK